VSSRVKFSSGFMPECTSKSVPNFSSCVLDFNRCELEQGIGQELRAISDSFHLEFGGFVSLLCYLF